MSDLVRTNIYITEYHQQSFASLSRQTGVTASEHIRRAADAYLTMHPPGEAPKAYNPIPVLDADGYVHGTLVNIEEEHYCCGDHDVCRLRWAFETPTTDGETTVHWLWTGTELISTYCAYEWEGATYTEIDGQDRNLDAYSLYTGMLVRLGVFTLADLTTHGYDEEGLRNFTNKDVLQRLEAFRSTFRVDSLIGTRCRYRLGLVRDLFFWFEDPPESKSSGSARDLSAALDGPDISTLELDLSS